MQLTCPKCQGVMRQYERNGIQVDQCTECRGIFLDRGELEKLIDAETSWHGAPAPQAAAPAPSRPPGYPQPGHQQRGYQQPGHQQQSYQSQPYQSQPYQEHGYREGHGHHKRKRRSFLEDLFD